MTDSTPTDSTITVASPNNTTVPARSETTSNTPAAQLSRKDVEREARSILIANKKIINCHACEKAGHVTTSSTNGGEYTRFQCSLKGCRASISAAEFLIRARDVFNIPVDTHLADVAFNLIPSRSNRSSTSRPPKRQALRSPSPPPGDVSTRSDPVAREEVSPPEQQNSSQALISLLQSQNASLLAELADLRRDHARAIQEANQKIADLTVAIERLSRAATSPSSHSIEGVISTPVHPPSDLSGPPLPGPSNPTTSPAPANRTRLSYAEVTSGCGMSGAEASRAVAAMQALCRRPRPMKKLDKAPKVEPVRIYINGISKGPLRWIRENLNALRIRSAAIINISFVGAITAECLVLPWYVDEFRARIAKLPIFTILENFDASVAADSKASNEVKKMVKEAFLRRVLKLAESPDPLVRAHFRDFATAHGASLPPPSQDMVIDPSNISSPPSANTLPTC
jgi:hypothetical protein